ncbi:MAG: GTPase domain-containing protein [Verrucomicrobiaceae bacterium]|nr:GTPase domain-containing protein [Verrucomicrobiaceae bacterium]
MPALRRQENLICFKIVYCGCSLSGKSTNLSQVYQRLEPSTGKMSTHTAGPDRTILLEFEASGFELIPDYGTAFQLCTVPGQAVYSATTTLLLRNADAVVFVVDSQTDRQAENLKAWQNLERAIKHAGLAYADLPLILQYNKRDLPTAAPIDYLEYLFNHRPSKFLSIESDAVAGRNVMATLNAACQGAVLSFQHQSVAGDLPQEAPSASASFLSAEDQIQSPHLSVLA